MIDEEYKKKKCPICGKLFYVPKVLCWGWVIGTERHPKPVCSYKCQREWEKRPAKKVNPSRKTIKIRIVETGEEFKSIADCVRHLNGSRSNIYNSINRGKAYKGLHFERVVE
jgi:hypothetical protein